jgi:small membrane protein
MKPIQFVLLAFVLAALAKVIHSSQQRRMRTLNFLFWTLVWLGTASIIIFPDATSFVAHILGIGRGADLIIYASLLVSFYLIFRIHLMLARLEQEITEIVRAIALQRLTEAVDSGAGGGKERGRPDRPQGVSSW